MPRCKRLDIKEEQTATAREGKQEERKAGGLRDDAKHRGREQQVKANRGPINVSNDHKTHGKRE